jgi:hypothetical protein
MYCDDPLDNSMDHILTECDAPGQNLIRQFVTNSFEQIGTMLAPALIAFHSDKSRGIRVLTAYSESSYRN